MKTMAYATQTDSTASNHASDGGYDPAFFEQLVRVEDEHFWFRARNELIFKLAQRVSSGFAPGYMVLEVGCGTGNVLRALRKACPDGLVVGMELWFDGLRHAQQRSSGLLVQGDVRQFPLGKAFNLVGMFDVLEHVQEDRETLSAIWNCLVPGGTLLLTVPAHQFLWSYFDEAAKHCRRYSADDLTSKLRAAGFQIKFVSEFMAAIFPVVWSVRKLRGMSTPANSAAKRARTAEEFRVMPIVNPILTTMLRLEARWLARGYRLPFGTSLVAIAQKPA